MVWTKLNQSQYYMMASDRAALNKYILSISHTARVHLALEFRLDSHQQTLRYIAHTAGHFI